MFRSAAGRGRLPKVLTGRADRSLLETGHFAPRPPRIVRSQVLPRFKPPALAVVHTLPSTPTRVLPLARFAARGVGAPSAPRVAKVQWLRRRLRELEDWQGAAATVPDDQATVVPDDFDDLWSRREELADFVEVTADASEMKELHMLAGADRFALAPSTGANSPWR